MKQILLATHNQGKINRYKKFLSHNTYQFVVLSDLGNIETGVFQEPIENGKDELENSLIKAQAYYEATKIPSFAEDTGFYINGLQNSEQPAKSVKSKAGLTLDLEQSLSKEAQFKIMTDYYIHIANSFGGQVHAYFVDAYCYFEAGHIRQAQAKRVLTLTNTIHEIDYNFPLCSLYLVNNIPYHQLTDQEMEQFLEPSTEVAKKLLEQQSD